LTETVLEADVLGFLERLHGAPVTALEPLSGGFWSTAYGYRVDDEELVLRLGDVRHGFEADRAAMAYASDDLPVPDVLDIGDAFGRTYCISRRHFGRFLEDVRPDEADRARPTVRRLLCALRDARPEPSAATAWRRWLVDTLVDDGTGPTAGWREKLAEHPRADALFERGAARVRELAPECPERRDLIHGDLLHGNVLVSDDASRVTAIFSWKCSVIGDFLFDTAWFTFWGEALHPGIGALDVIALMADDAGPDAALRHHCYEVHIGTTHLGWHAWTDDPAGLEQVASHLEAVLDRGPRGR